MRLSVCRRPAVACLAVCWAVSLPVPPAAAHEIPSDVAVRIIVRPAADRLDVLVRAPLEAMQDIVFPATDAGFLDVARAGPALTNSAMLWLADDIRLFADDVPLGRPTLEAVRATIPSDRSFTDFESALNHLRGAPIPPGTPLVWQQALLDAWFSVPLPAPAAAFAIEPDLGRLGLAVAVAIRFEPPGGTARAFQLDASAGAGPATVDLDPRWHRAALRFVAQGFEHILDGTDHLLFLLCLVLPFRRDLRSLVVIVTAFTVAHSLTLIGSAFGLAPQALWFMPLVETLIALSILYMAVENVLLTNVRTRWMLAFGFGLVHGFGFSFALRDTLQFAGDHILTSLLAFNVGVELGQLAVLAVLIPVLAAVFRRVPEKAGIVVISVLVGHTAWHWMTESYADFRQYPVAWAEPAARDTNTDTDTRGRI